MLLQSHTHCSSAHTARACTCKSAQANHLGIGTPLQQRTRRHRSLLHPPAVLKGTEGSTQVPPPLQHTGPQPSQPQTAQPTSHQPADAPADVQGEFPAIFDYQHMPHFSLPLALYFPLGLLIGAARVALWVICIALDLPVFRNRSVIDAYLAVLGVNVTWHGLDRLPKGFHVMVSNHSNCGDLMALFMLPQRYIHLISPAIPPQTMSAKHLPVLLRPAVLDTYEELARSAQNPDSPPVHVFPEGGMTNGKGIMQFSRGFAKLAPPGTPVVPVALRTHIPWGLRTHTLTSSFPVNLFLYNLCPQVHIEATVLPPMMQGEGEGVPPSEGRGAFVKRVQAAIAQHLGVPVSEINMQQKRQLMKEYQKRQQQRS